MDDELTLELFHRFAKRDLCLDALILRHEGSAGSEADFGPPQFVTSKFTMRALVVNKFVKV
jgi:hypothetical protein